MTRFLYIIYSWLVVIPMFLILTIMVALTTTIGCLLGGERIFSYYPGMIWSKLTCRLALLPVSIKGLENIEKGKSYIFAANHQGAFDIFLIYGFLGVPIKWVMKAGIRKIPFVGTACKAAGFVFVDNTSRKKAAESVRLAEKCIQKGTSIAIFPEGSRSYNGKMTRFKKGAFQIAVDQKLEIVPITLNGPFDVLPIGSLNLHRNPLEMVIHKPITINYEHTDHKDLQELANRTRNIIQSALWEKYQ